MQIFHEIDDFLFELFPRARQQRDNPNVLKDEVARYYTIGPYKPVVVIDEGWLKITIDMPTILAQEADFRKVVSFCEKRKFAEAKQLLNRLLDLNKSNSEYYRIYGQIFSDEGNQDDAIDCLIDALRWDPKNGWALIMMGNILARHRDNIPAAMKYYDQVLKVDPRNHIALNNIGANLMQQKKTEEAKKYFTEALKINSDYPNTYYGLGLIAETENNLPIAFENAILAIRKNPAQDALYQNSVALALNAAKRIAGLNNDSGLCTEYLHKLEFLGGVKIELKEDRSIPTAAKFELAENYNRSNHVVRYNPDYPAVTHLQMHELVHLAFIIEARQAGSNLLFIATQKQKSAFIKSIESSIARLLKAGLPESAIPDYCSSIFDGINLQSYNVPIDLFIEEHLYRNFKALRPYQFISLLNLLKAGLKAVTDKKIAEHAPADILSKSRIYNLVNALQFKDLFGFDTTAEFHPSSAELSRATAFYKEFLQHKDNRKPAEEYELVLNWAEALGLDKNFELIDENEFRNKRTDIDGMLNSIEKDPYDLDSKDIYKKRDEEKFQKSQKDNGINMAVVMFMVEALDYFKDMPVEKIKAIAYEIALLGTRGLSPDKNGYTVNSIPKKEFSGYHILAYYYISWQLSAPDMVAQLNLPYDGEYEMAKKLQKN